MDETIARIAERELGARPDGVERPDEGLLHETYVLACGGEEYVLQFAGEDAGPNDDLSRGVGWYRALAADPMPVPQVVTERPHTLDGRAYVLLERLPGQNAERDVTPERARAAGRVLARIHEARRFDRVGWTAFDDGGAVVVPFPEEDHRRRVRHGLAVAARGLREAGMESASTSIEGILECRDGSLPATVEPVLCHRDFSPDNVLFDDGAVTGVLDFDRAVAGASHYDLAQAATAFWMHDPAADWDPRQRFYDGYHEVADTLSAFDGLEPLYRVAALATVLDGMIRLDELTEYERQFYEDALLEATERLH